MSTKSAFCIFTGPWPVWSSSTALLVKLTGTGTPACLGEGARRWDRRSFKDVYCDMRIGCALAEAHQKPTNKRQNKVNMTLSGVTLVAVIFFVFHPTFFFLFFSPSHSHLWLEVRDFVDYWYLVSLTLRMSRLSLCLVRLVRIFLSNVTGLCWEI